MNRPAGMFLCGTVRHGKENFCFIYKYRQRFAVVAQAIASSLGHETDDFVKPTAGGGHVSTTSRAADRSA